MQEIVTVKAVAGSDYVGDWRTIAKQILDPLSPIEIKESPFGYDFIFDHFPSQIEEIVHQLKAQEFSSSYYVRRQYLAQELMSAQFLLLGFEDVVDSVDDTLTWHTKLICPSCNYQETVWNIEELQIEEDGLGYRLALVDWHVRVMSRALAEALRNINSTGLQLDPVGGNEPAEWYGVTSTHTLPPFSSPPTRLSSQPYNWTDNCVPNHGFGVNDVHSELFYEQNYFNGRDFNFTNELWGDRDGGVRRMVISNRVYRSLVELGVEQLKCEPIRFIE